MKLVITYSQVLRQPQHPSTEVIFGGHRAPSGPGAGSAVLPVPPGKPLGIVAAQGIHHG
jgi:hypothetical protein